MMKRNLRQARAQTALEYMLILAIVAAIVLVGFKVFLPRSRDAAFVFFNTVTNQIMGNPPTNSKTQ